MQKETGDYKQGIPVLESVFRPRRARIFPTLRREAKPEIERRRAAYDALIRENEAALLRASWRLCKGRQEAAQDLVQETLVRGYEAFLEGRFREGSNARAWFLRILTNLFLNDYRRQKWVADVDVDRLAAEGAPGMAAMQAAPEDQPDAALMAATLDEALERALAVLSTELRVCVVLVDIEGCAYTEAAAILDIPIGTVRSRLSRARIQLHALLYDYAAERRRA
jgi:RNA polymerase sigma-70 factor (ECF subfamily)